MIGVFLFQGDSYHQRTREGVGKGVPGKMRSDRKPPSFPHPTGRVNRGGGQRGMKGESKVLGVLPRKKCHLNNRVKNRYRAR